MYGKKKGNEMRLNDTQKRRLANMALLLTGLIWGSGFVVMKNALDGISINYLLAIRFTIGALGLGYVFFVNKQPLEAEELRAGAEIGLLLYLSFVSQTYGLSLTTAGKNALVTAFYVVLVPLLLWAIKRRRPEGRIIVSAALMIAGIALLTLNGEGGMNRGDMLTLCCSFGYAAQIILVDKYAERYDIMRLTCLQFVFGALYSWVAALSFEQPPAAITGETVWALAYCGVACTLIGFTLENIGVKYASPEYATLFMSTESAFGCLFGVLVLHETMTGRMWLGCALVLGALVLSQVDWQMVINSRRKKKGTQHA